MDSNKRAQIIQSLNDTHTWPTDYKFKFILKSTSNQIDNLTSLFPNNNHVSYRSSKDGNYTSITIIDNVKSAEEVLLKHELSSKIEGIISL